MRVCGLGERVGEKVGKDSQGLLTKITGKKSGHSRQKRLKEGNTRGRE